jgi:hypothetical protein
MIAPTAEAVSVPEPTAPPVERSPVIDRPTRSDEGPRDESAPDLDQAFEAKMQWAQTAVSSGQYDEAAAALEAAYRIRPLRAVLLDWAHAERRAERCERAVFLYGRYLASVSADPPAEDAEARQSELAEEGRRACLDQSEQPPAELPGVVLVIRPPRSTWPAPSREPEAEPSPRRSGPSPVVSVEPPRPPSNRPPPPPPRRDDQTWRSDPVGWSLIGTGMLSAAGAGGLFAVAHTAEPDPTVTPSHAAYLDGVRRASRLEIGGWSFVAIGSALVVAGIVRLAFVANRERQRRARWVFVLDPM